jgi:hypothetical protein
MRKSVLLWLVLATFSGIALFHTGQKVHDGREKLSLLNSNIGKEEESIRVLQAEWGYLNQPRRLEKLAKEHLNLAPMKGRQFARLDDIPLRGQKPTADVPPPEKENVVVSALPAAIAEAEKPAPAPAPVPPPAAVSSANERKISDVLKSLSEE